MTTSFPVTTGQRFRHASALAGSLALALSLAFAGPLRAADEDFHQAWRATRAEGWDDA